MDAFPVEDGVEVRTMGNTLRPVRLHVLKADKQGGGFEHFNLKGELFLTDDEDNRGIVPHVTRIHLDHGTSGSSGVISGRVYRRTTDNIAQADGKDFKKGYMREYRDGTPEREVSEPFMLLDIVALDREAFDAKKAEAIKLFEENNGRVHEAAYWS
jgi:hypothetical protein